MRSEGEAVSNLHHIKGGSGGGSAGREGTRPPASDSEGEGSVGKHLRLGRTQKEMMKRKKKRNCASQGCVFKDRFNCGKVF